MDSDWGPPFSAYSLVEVVKLPVPHNPSRLPGPLLTDWRTMGDLPGVGSGPVRTRGDLARWVGRQRARPDLARLWDLARIDWGRAAELARRVWASGEQEWPSRAHVDAVLAREPDDVAIAADGLCFRPITWSPGDETLTDGQHRSLALAVQGVVRVLVCGTQ